MATPIYYPPSVNNLQKEINADYTAGASTVTLNNTTNIQNKPGVCIVNRVNRAGTRQVVSKWTYLKFTGTSGNTLTGVTAISGDQDHAIGEVVEFVPDVTWAEQVAGGFATLLDVTDVSKVNTTNVITPDGTQTLTNKTLTSPTINNPTTKSTTQVVAAVNATVGGTTTLDLSAGGIQNITMGAGNTTIALSNVTTNQPFIISITQDGTGSRTVTWFSTIKWAGGSAPTLTTTASKRDTFGFICTGTNTYDGFIVGQNI